MVKFLSKKGKKSPKELHDKSLEALNINSSEKEPSTVVENKSKLPNFCLGSSSEEKKGGKEYDLFDDGEAYDKDANEPMFFMSKRNETSNDPTASLMDDSLLILPQNEVHVTYANSKAKGRKSIGAEKNKGSLLRLKKSIRRLRKNDRSENDDKNWKNGAALLVDEVGQANTPSKSISKDDDNRDDAWLVDDDVFKDSWPTKEKDITGLNKIQAFPEQSPKNLDGEGSDFSDLFGGDPFGSDFGESDQNQLVQMKLDAVEKCSPLKELVDIHAFDKNTNLHDAADSSSERDYSIPKVSTREDIQIFTFDTDEDSENGSNTQKRPSMSPNKNDPGKCTSEHVSNNVTSEIHQPQSGVTTPTASKNNSLLTLISIAQSSGMTELDCEDTENIYGNTYTDDGDDDEVHQENHARPMEISVPSTMGNIRNTRSPDKQQAKNMTSPNGKKDGAPFQVDLSLISMNEDNMLDNDANIDLTATNATANNADSDISSYYNPSVVRNDPINKQNANSQSLQNKIKNQDEESYDNKENMSNHYDRIDSLDDILAQRSDNDRWIYDKDVLDNIEKHETLLELILNEDPNDDHDIFIDRGENKNKYLDQQRVQTKKPNESHISTPRFGNTRIKPHQNHVSSPMRNNKVITTSQFTMGSPRNFKSPEQQTSGSTFFWRSHPNAGKNVKALTGKIREQLQPRHVGSDVEYMEKNISSKTPTSSNAGTFTDSECSDHRRGRIDQTTVRNALITSSNLDENKVETYRKQFQRPPAPFQGNNLPNKQILQNSDDSIGGAHDRKIFFATHPKQSQNLMKKKGSNNLLNHIEKNKPLPHQTCASSLGETSSVKQRIAVFESGGL